MAAIMWRTFLDGGFDFMHSKNGKAMRFVYIGERRGPDRSTERQGPSGEAEDFI